MPLVCSVAGLLPLVCSNSRVMRPGPVLAALVSYCTVLQNVRHSDNWLSWTFKRSQLDHIWMQHNELDYICCILSFEWFPSIWFYMPMFQNTLSVPSSLAV